MYLVADCGNPVAARVYEWVPEIGAYRRSEVDLSDLVAGRLDEFRYIGQLHEWNRDGYLLPFVSEYSSQLVFERTTARDR